MSFFCAFVSVGSVGFWGWLGEHKEQITLIREILTSLVVIPAAWWALFVYKKGKKREETARVQQLFASFYLSPEFGRLRYSLEIDYDQEVRPLIAKILNSDETKLSEDEGKRLCDLDLALNHFEYVLHLENEGQITKGDRRALFGYWYRWLAAPGRIEVRTYIREYGYAALAALLSKMQHEELMPRPGPLVAFYGTLRQDCGGEQEAELRRRLKFLGACRIRGKLLNLGPWPGLQDSTGIVIGELYESSNNDFALLDKHEGDEFERRRVPLVDPDVEAYVYYYVGRASGPLIASGDWARRDPVVSA